MGKTNYSMYRISHINKKQRNCSAFFLCGFHFAFFLFGFLFAFLFAFALHLARIDRVMLAWLVLKLYLTSHVSFLLPPNDFFLVDLDITHEACNSTVSRNFHNICQLHSFFVKLRAFRHSNVVTLPCSRNYRTSFRNLQSFNLAVQIYSKSVSATEAK